MKLTSTLKLSFLILSSSVSANTLCGDRTIDHSLTQSEISSLPTNDMHDVLEFISMQGQRTRNPVDFGGGV